MLAVFILLLPVGGHAQVSGATLTGTVTDPSGAVVPNAKLTIRNVATGIVTQATTNTSGRYTAPNLLPGTYDVSIKATGFQTTQRNNINLTVGANQLENFSLKVGSATQRVVVSAAAVQIQLASSDVKGVLSNRQVQNLPLNGRDWTTLATLQPGVSSIAGDQADPNSSDRTRRGYGVQMAISGARPTQDSYRIDGINVNGYANGGPGSVEGATLGVSAVQEFSVMTSNYSAAYGRTSGGIVNALTKSGTNKLHGTAYEYVRNSALDASPYFTDAAAGVPKPSFGRNQYGASLGGPIHKNKTFFFADYEGLRSNEGIPTQALVPSRLIRGIGTGSGGSNGPSVVSCTTISTYCGNDGYGAGKETLYHYAADNNFSLLNPDPVTGINQAVLPYLGLWNLPNAGTVGNGDQGIYVFNAVTDTTEHFGDARIDEKLSSKDSLFGTFQIDTAGLTQPDPNNNVLYDDNTARDLVVLEETHIFSPTMINSARFGFSRDSTTNGSVKAINPLSGNAALGEISGQDNMMIDVPNFTSAQPGVNQVEVLNVHKNSFQGYDDLFVTRGKNSMKFGFAVENIRTNEYDAAPNGEVQFNSLYDPANNAFLLNSPAVFAAPVPGVPFVHYNFHTTIWGVYAQDDVNVLPNLTLNIGLRYEMSTVPNETKGQLSAIPTPFNQSLATAHIGHTLWSNPTLHNFEPRIGFAWDPFKTGKTSIRGGFGMFDVLPLNYLLGQFATNAAPFVQNTQISTGTTSNVCGASGTSSCALVPGDFPFGESTKLAQSVAAGLSQRVPYVQPNPKRNYVMQWNLAVQREITPSLSGMIAYVGSHGVHQVFRSDDINSTLPTSTSAGYFFPVNGTVLSPNIGRMDSLQWIDSSEYNAMELQLNKKMSHGFDMGASYTWGRSIDGGDGSLASDSFLNSIPGLFYFLPKYRRGPSDFNIQQNLTVHYLWDLPTPFKSGFAAGFTKGWQVGGIVTAQTGMPFTPLIGGDPLGLGSSAAFAYPNRLRGGNCSSLTNPGNVNNYIKLSCFALPTAPSTIPSGVTCVPFSAVSGTCANLLGNGGRNEIYGPGIVDTDFSVVKNTKIRESMTLQFRAEMFNLFNHPNFKPPIDNSTLFNSDGTPAGNAGALDSTSTNAREIQFAVQLMF